MTGPKWHLERDESRCMRRRMLAAGCGHFHRAQHNCAEREKRQGRAPRRDRPRAAAERAPAGGGGVEAGGAVGADGEDELLGRIPGDPQHKVPVVPDVGRHLPARRPAQRPSCNGAFRRRERGGKPPQSAQFG